MKQAAAGNFAFIEPMMVLSMIAHVRKDLLRGA
jgi:hypothetical protein